jgi:hypothetical protein
MDTKKTEES